MKKFAIIFLVLVLVMGNHVVFGAENSARNAADALYELGLFKGTGVNADGSPVYGLDAVSTRAQALVMLIRLLGLEEEALAGNWRHPFTDVPAWAQGYVGYAYKNGLTLGMSENTFGSDVAAQANMYLTFVLRALKYSDSGLSADFSYGNALEFAKSIGLTDHDYSSFLRGDIALVSKKALGLKLKGSDTTLIQTLVASGAVKEEKAYETGLILKQYKDGDIVQLPAQYRGAYAAKTKDIKRIFPGANAILSTGHDGSHKTNSKIYSEAEMEFLVSLNIANIEKEANYIVMVGQPEAWLSGMYYSHYILDEDFNILGICYPMNQTSGRDYIEVVWGSNGVNGAELYRATKETIDKSLQSYDSAKIEVADISFSAIDDYYEIHPVSVNGLPLKSNQYIATFGIYSEQEMVDLGLDIYNCIRQKMFEVFYFSDYSLIYADGTTENLYFSPQSGGDREEYDTDKYGVKIPANSLRTLVIVYEPNGDVIGYAVFSK